MGTNELFYQTPLWAMGVGGMLLLMVATEIGFRAGRRRDGEDDESRSGEFSTIQGGILGMLGLLLAFSYSLAAERYEKRKDLVVEESNAIGTAWLRAGLAPQPHRGELEGLLRRYVALRLELSSAPIFDPRVSTALHDSEDVQRSIWAVISRMAPGSSTALDLLLVEATNQLIDVHSTRLAALRDHVPESVLFLLLFVAMVALGIAGFAAGCRRRRNLFLTVMLSGLIILVMLVTLDLDRPQRGLIQVNQESMLELQKSLEAPH